MKAYRFTLRYAGWLKWIVLAAWALWLWGYTSMRWQYTTGLVPLALLTLLLVAGIELWARWARERVIREQPLPQFLKRKLRQVYPHLTQKDADLVERGLRQFFLACNRSRGRFVAMPSRAVDQMWHDFILHTAAYRDWCALALGRFLHHTPAEALGSQATHNDGLRRAWFWTCKEEAINPRVPTRLPLLFALDGKLAIEGGFNYVPDCTNLDPQLRSIVHCGTDFGSATYGGDCDGFGGADASSSDSGDGGGDGGGCGGGSE